MEHRHGSRSGDRDRQAIGDEHDGGEPRDRRGLTVGLRGRHPRRRLAGDPQDVRAMQLADVGEAHAQLGLDRSPVSGHGVLLVAGHPAEVEGGVGPGGEPAPSGGEHGPGARQVGGEVLA